ncbi:GAF and ANTAR domain-containing protein [Amycolatopsis anabasis]|uniref:GAF and ANTAR domain-containing protein n=1 Tax=Amycolatopsis anabasis TaxID=1840409 RepID=UPI00131DE684|nr:GAF and ANTAR domain-containing protein [Amycolatopsis anabasis]
MVVGEGTGGVDRVARVWAWVSEYAGSRDTTDSVGALCETMVARLGVSGAWLTVFGSRQTSDERYTTGELAVRLADLQVMVGEGPSADARRTGGPVLVPVLDAQEVQRRWPLFVPLAVEAGARALFTLPLSVGAIRLGVLALYRVERGPLPPDGLADSLIFAGLARQLLLAEKDGLLLGEHGAAGLGYRLSNPRIHQATGMIAGQLGVGVEEAFARLRARAFADHRPLAEVAADVVTRHLRFEPGGETE